LALATSFPIRKPGIQSISPK